jgi:hypothetical protein
MRQAIRRQGPALALAFLALFAALGGSVYAKKHRARRINGKLVRVKSLPGNRLALASVPGNRLKPGALPGNRLGPNSITGGQIDEASLNQVPSAVHAETADTAVDSQTALNAVNAVNATTVNGHEVGCRPGTTPFAGACWDASPSEAAKTAPAAAVDCASRGGRLPEALELAAFADEPGVKIATTNEWSSDIPVYSGSGTYAVITVSSTGEIGSVPSTETLKYRCVMPLVS